MSWSLANTGLTDLDAETEKRLLALPEQNLPSETVLFRPGDAVRGFAIVLSGQIDVFLTGASGRELLLYSVAPGQSCVQSTLGLLGGDDYTGEAIVAKNCRVVLIPRELFLSLLDSSPPFRRFVFRAFADRMQSTMHVLERVAFQKVESRLAEILLDRCKDGIVHATHQDLAVSIGSAREVISRRLDAMARRGIVRLDRGAVHILDSTALTRLADEIQ